MISRRIVIILMVSLGHLIILPQAMANQIIEITGSVSVRRNGASNYQPATVGTVLNRGDLIRPDARAKVIVLCSSNTTWYVPPGVPSGIENGCPDTRSRFNTRGRGEDDFLAFLNQQFTYATQFITDRPLFRWHAIDHATAYQVQITDSEGTILWKQTVQDTELRYSGDALQLGKPYELQVTAIDRPDMTPFRLVFRILDESEATAVQATVNELENADLTESGKAIALAQIYQSVAQPNTLPPEGTGLVMEAIPLLEAVIPNNSTPYIHQLLGDLYLQVGLLEQATTQYQQVIEQTHSSADTPNRAAAQVGLANIAAANGERDQAETWLQQAKSSYEELGEGDRVSLIDQWITKLKR